MKKRFWLHAAFWFAFWFVYSYTYSRYDGNFVKYASGEAALLPFRMVAVYGSLWVLGRFGGRTAWLVSGIVLSNFLAAIGNRFVKMVLVVPHIFPESSFEFWHFSRFFVELFDCVLVTCGAIALRLFFRQQEMSRREEALRREKIAAELQALKSQVQPHFLFNTINNLYALARQKSDKTAPVALKLANLLRFVLYETRKPEIPIELEIKILRDYIALEQLRFDADRLRVDVQIEMDNPQQPITPLLLLPLVENAFKHGASEHRSEAWVRLDLNLKNGKLALLLANSRDPNQAPNPAGIGLENVRRQLELIYPDQHKLEIRDEGMAFEVRLDIDFQALPSNHQIAKSPNQQPA